MVSLSERWNFIEVNRLWFAYQGIPGEDFMRYPFFSHAIMMGDVPGILVEQMRTVRLRKGADDSGPTA